MTDELFHDLRAAERRLSQQLAVEMEDIEKKHNVVPFISARVERIDVTSVLDERCKYKLGLVSVTLTVSED